MKNDNHEIVFVSSWLPKFLKGTTVLEHREWYMWPNDCYKWFIQGSCSIQRTF